MPRQGFASPTLPSATYELARNQAEKEGISTAQLIAKAIERYINVRQEKEETARIVLETMDKMEKMKEKEPKS